MEKSIPLYRFLRGKTEENVVFAMKGTDFTGVSCIYWPMKGFHMHCLKISSLSSVAVYVF